MSSLQRRIYRRGDSFETTIPMPLLFGLDPSRKYYAVFRYDKGEWYLEFKEIKEK